MKTSLVVFVVVLAFVVLDLIEALPAALPQGKGKFPPSGKSFGKGSGKGFPQNPPPKNPPQNNPPQNNPPQGFDGNKNPKNPNQGFCAQSGLELTGGKQRKQAGQKSCADTQLGEIPDYYAKSQELNAQGLINGHSHITVQKFFDNVPPNPQNPAFFKGLNDPAKNGVLSVTVDALPPGQYRICTMNSSRGHQGVIMPVANRGAQDD
ncbi:4855_t:CDS:2, partial [Racocetra fulgida]